MSRVHPRDMLGILIDHIEEYPGISTSELSTVIFGHGNLGRVINDTTLQLLWALEALGQVRVARVVVEPGRRYERSWYPASMTDNWELEYGEVRSYWNLVRNSEDGLRRCRNELFYDGPRYTAKNLWLSHRGQDIPLKEGAEE